MYKCKHCISLYHLQITATAAIIRLSRHSHCLLFQQVSMHASEIMRHLRHALAQLSPLRWVLTILSRCMPIYYVLYYVHKWLNAVFWYYMHACTSVPSKIQPHTGSQNSSQMLFGRWWRQKTRCAGEGLLLQMQSRFWPLLESRFIWLSQNVPVLHSVY